MSEQTIVHLGKWLTQKWANRVDESGGDYFTVATQMRKQGIPLAVALAVFFGRGL